MKAILALESGKVFKGLSFGAEGESYGEVVFNTSMTGYQEILTDPSYKGQIVAMTYPLIGNYGVNEEDVESRKPFVEGFVVKEYSKHFSSWRGSRSLGAYLKANKIIGIEGVDTRSLTLHIRQAGAMKAVISTKDTDIKRLIKKAKDSPGLIGIDLAKEVSAGKKYTWRGMGSNRKRIAVIDTGVKYDILRKLAKNGCDSIVVPITTTADEIIDMAPDGILLPNGPGDPAAVGNVVEVVRQLIGKFPIFGICLGHQMLGLAFGGKTFKLKFGHHGANHPVKDLKTGKVCITSQNHGFCVDIGSLNKKEIEMTHVNLNDGTPEGLRHKKLPIFSVQFHPESAPGPHDSEYLFGEFVKLIDEDQGRHAKKKRH
ncbi:MAG: glutamine-hydrolyzing carbamoyl-phosphate synthase small subunit [Candidatus Omnitrophota bacterium]|jgi:carbamoyl-phosphate synthase small subunit